MEKSTSFVLSKYKDTYNPLVQSQLIICNKYKYTIEMVYLSVSFSIKH